MMSGVRAEVAQVFMMSCSGINSLHLHFGHSLINGLSSSGSIGNWDSSAIIGSSHSLQYHTGNGIPKGICLEMHQSHFKPLTQLVYLCFIWSGCHFTSLPHFIMSSLMSRYFTNHCFEFLNSIGVWHLS